MAYPKILILLILMVTALAAGCGYRFHADGRPEGIDIASLAIPMMESTSSTLGFESDFTEAVRSEFISHGDVPLVSEAEAAVVLEGKIREIKTTPMTYDMTETRVGNEDTYYEVTDSRRLFVRLDARLLDRRTGKIIWEEKGMEDMARYPVTKDPLTNRYNERTALRKIAGRLVDRIYSRTMEQF